MNIVLTILGVVILLAIVLLNTKVFEPKDKRKKYLQALAGFLEAKLGPIPDRGNSYQIRFSYRGKEFVYEDVEDRLQKSCIYNAYLKVPTASKLKIDFTERPRTTIRANVQTLNDIKTPWARDAEKVILPPELQEYTVYTNDNLKTNKLLANDKIIKIFARFKNMTSLGHPHMSLEVMDGSVILTFHPPGELKPTWGDLQNNASLIEGYIDQLNVLVEEINALEKK